MEGSKLYTIVLGLSREKIRCVPVQSAFSGRAIGVVMLDSIVVGAPSGRALRVESVMVRVCRRGFGVSIFALAALSLFACSFSSLPVK
jgi:hypothetical protein